MPKTVRTEKELANAIENGEDTIIIEGDLKRQVIRIKATGKVAWAACFGAIGIAVIAILVAVPTGGSSSVAAAAVAPVAVGIIGGPATLTAIGIAVAAGGAGVLNRLRRYNLDQGGGKCILTKTPLRIP